MKKNSLVEYTAYALARFLGVIIVSLPIKINCIIGESIGILGYCLLKKKRRLVLKNIKIAFGEKLGRKEVEAIARKAFVSLALNIIEILYIPRIDARHINKHVRIENLKYFDDALKRGKGVILLAYHLGNWELANITCGLQGYAYKVIVNEQRYPLLNNLLNRYRESKGCKTIPRGAALREILRGLKHNEVVAMVGDQGGKEGQLSTLCGLPTSIPTGFARFALATGASVIPAIIVRDRRFSHRIILERPLAVDSAKDEQDNVSACMAQSNRILEKYISKYPQEYFWFYKIWKYSPCTHVIALSDGKAGHLRQAEAVLASLQSVKPMVRAKVIEVKFKNGFFRALATLCIWLGLDIFEFCLSKETYAAVREIPADAVISCGSSLAGLNAAIAKENLAKSICIMKPGIISAKRFDLVIMPKHDNPPQGKNIVETLGALSLIDDVYVQEHAERLKEKNPGIAKNVSLGLFIGGDTKQYVLTEPRMREVSAQIKKISDELNADILITTSRRTPAGIESIIKEEFKDCPRCKLLVIANEQNIPEAVGGILGLADFVLVSGESISMISEAASSGKYVGVFKLKSKALFPRKTRHEVFLENLANQGYIYIVAADTIAYKIKELFINKPLIKKLDDRGKVKEAIRKLL